MRKRVLKKKEKKKNRKKKGSLRAECCENHKSERVVNIPGGNGSSRSEVFWSFVNTSVCRAFSFDLSTSTSVLSLL